MSDAPLRCRDLVCGYAGKPRVQNVDLCVEPAQFLAIIGGSGAGKSTLLKTLAGLLPPIAGCVELFGNDLYAISWAERRRLLRRVGVLFQADALFGSMSILENVCLPARELTSLPDPVVTELAQSRLALVGVAELAARRPSEVSGGQAKRAALARATVLDPKLLFCDEPTAALDPISAAEVDKTLLRLRDLVGTTVVAVSHDLASIERTADRVLVLGPTGVLQSGSVDELRQSDDAFLRAFFHNPVASQPGGKAT